MQIYYNKRLEEPVVLEQGNYKGYDYYIITLGTHPCCYVVLPKEHEYYKESCFDIPIECHYGLTYSESNLMDRLEEGKYWVIGWDYAHFGDYLSYYIALLDGDENGHKWTLDELRQEVYLVIEQL